MIQSAARPTGQLRLWPRWTALLLVGLALAVSGADPAGAATGPAPKVVVVAIPALQWDDLTPSATPTMWQLLATGSAGVLSVKSSRDLAGCADGLLTLGAGNRAAAEASSAAPTPCSAQTATQRAELDQRQRDTAGLGALAAALRADGVRTATVGAGAAIALPDADVDAPTLADDGGAAVVVAVDDAVYTAAPADRRAAVHSVDDWLTGLLIGLPASTTVLVVGSSDRPTPAGEPGGPAVAHLHVALARGPGFPTGSLQSPSTKRTPYVELIDVAPTVLQLVGGPIPDSMVGRPWRSAGGPGSAATRAADLRDLDVKAVRGAHARPPFMYVLSGLALLVALGGLLVATRSRPGSSARRVVGTAAYVVASLPFASWLIQLVPWWRWPAVLLCGLLLLVAGAVGTMAAVISRSAPSRGLLVVAGASGVLLLADLVTGSRLQTAALLGDSPITAGRFYGAGNTAFGVLAASALLGAAVACAVPADRPRRSAVRGALVVALVLAVCAGVDAGPTLGADVGGGLALMPSAVVVVLLLARVRLTVRRLLAALAVGAVPVVILALWDYHRPPQRRTHIGDFVAQVRDGQGGQVIGRKVSANLGQLVGSPFLALVVGTVAIVAYVLWRQRDLARATLARTPGLSAGLVGFTVCALLGAVLNDSGVTVTGIMLSVALPAVTALALRADPIDDR